MIAIHVIVDLATTVLVLLHQGMGVEAGSSFGPGTAQTFLGARAGEFFSKVTAKVDSLCNQLFTGDQSQNRSHYPNRCKRYYCDETNWLTSNRKESTIEVSSLAPINPNKQSEEIRRSKQGIDSAIERKAKMRQYVMDAGNRFECITAEWWNIKMLTGLG